MTFLLKRNSALANALIGQLTGLMGAMGHFIQVRGISRAATMTHRSTMRLRRREKAVLPTDNLESKAPLPPHPPFIISQYMKGSKPVNDIDIPSPTRMPEEIKASLSRAQSIGSNILEKMHKGNKKVGKVKREKVVGQALKKRIQQIVEKGVHNETSEYLFLDF